ncbi:MAG: hypothetical protein V7641_5216 [Blastocatellia bacterium]
MEEASLKIGNDVPDIALAGMGLPGMTGIEGMQFLKERYPKLSILVLRVYDDGERIFRALCAGACGYLLKKTSPAKWFESLQPLRYARLRSEARPTTPASVPVNVELIVRLAQALLRFTERPGRIRGSSAAPTTRNRARPTRRGRCIQTYRSCREPRAATSWR